MTMKVKDVMTTSNVVTVTPSDTLDLAAQLLLWGGISHLPVLQGGRVVGMIAERDVIVHRPDNGTRMPTVGEAMTTPVQTVDPEDDLAIAATTMAGLRISCVPVVEDGALVGIITSGDILAHQVGRTLRPRPNDSPPISGIMTRDVATARPGDDLTDAVARMVARGIRHLPVVDGAGWLVGIVSDRDVRAAVGNPGLALENDRGRGRLSRLKVGDIMTRGPFTVGPDETVTQVAHYLVDRQIGAVPVVDDAGLLLGIASYVDVLRALLPA